MTDKELLEYAAKAAKTEIVGYRYDELAGNLRYVLIDLNGIKIKWNPIVDDGDAFRLLTRLSLFKQARDNKYYPPAGKDIYAATRRAIVFAAAEIGKDMK